MLIYQYRYKKDAIISRNIALVSAVNSMLEESQTQPITTYRRSLLSILPGLPNRYKERLPVYLFSGTFIREGQQVTLREYTGLILIEVDHLLPEETTQLRKEASSMPQTILAFTGSSGSSVKIVVRFTLPDGTLPKKDKQITTFHEAAYRTAVALYQPQLSRNITLKDPLINHPCRKSYDPELYFNPEAIAIRMEQPDGLFTPTRKEVQILPESPASYLDRLMPGLERNRQLTRLFRMALLEAIRTRKDDSTKTLEPIREELAANCFRSGIPEEDAIQCCLMFKRWLGAETDIRQIFRIAYQLEKGFGKKPAIPKHQALTLEIEEFLNRRYIFRRNEMSGGVEYRDRSLVDFKFYPFSKEVQNSICIEAQKEGLNAWDKDIQRHILSTHVPSYHPIEDYLAHLPDWDGKDHIRSLAGRVPNDNPLWKDLFYRWMISMVAHWLDMEHTHANTTTPLLVGDQGCGKSTFCLNLLPPELRMYYTDTVDFSKQRDTELALHRYALINIDEFDRIKESQQSFLKHILQKTNVNTRLPHQSTNSCLRRYATFIATSNTTDLLTDPTGSRRFLCVEVKGIIDLDQPVIYEQLYAQIMHALKNGERFWLTREEEKELTESNRKFRQTTPEEDIFFTYFSIPEAGKPGKFLKGTQILEHIRKRNPKFTFTRGTVNRLGQVMTYHEVLCRRNKGGKEYWVSVNG